MKRSISILSKTLLFLLLSCPLQTRSQNNSASTKYIDSALAQTNTVMINCSADVLIAKLRSNADYLSRERKMNLEIANKIVASKTGIKSFGTGPGGIVDTVVLPVVFHIINNNPVSISDAQIINALKDLNDAFSKTGNYAASKGADTRIRFDFAKKDPAGGNTKGINRITSYYSLKMNMANEDARLKNLMQWDPAKYINIWLVTDIVGEISSEFSCSVWTRTNAGGYATLPPGGSATDGIVVTGFGALLAHEMGHYLGLYHTFEGSCTNNNCLTDGDRVCDTPPDGYTKGSINCNSPINSCNTDTLSNYSNGFILKDTVDQISNFMDYGNTVCSNQFTEGQSERMRAAIATQRAGLVSNLLVLPCNENIIASFTRNIADPKAGELINFTSTSTGTTNFEWSVNDIVEATTQSFSRSFPLVGKNKVTLKAFNTAGCFASSIDYILVKCGITARFSNNKKTVASKLNVFADTILFTNNSQHTLSTASSYDWVITNSGGTGRQIVTSNVVGGTPNDLNYVFPVPGSYLVKLIAKNGVCIDSTDAINIFILDPTPDAFLGITGVNCYQETKVRVSFYVCNFGYAPLQSKIPISFYDADPATAVARKIGDTFIFPDSIKGSCCGNVYSQILDVKYARLNKIYGVVNDTGTAIPVQLPNTAILERNYLNNTTSFSNFRFRVVPIPSVATLEPGDTLKLVGQTTPDPTATSTFLWDNPNKLSCTTCPSPFLYADTNTTKRVIATSQYQCLDTAFVNILVPPANDYTVVINNIICSPKEDSLIVDFTIFNSFKRGVIPKDLLVTFYKADPGLAGSLLAAPVFKVPDSVLLKQKSYQYKIKKIAAGNLFASVNDNGAQTPVQLSNSLLLEKEYANNIANTLYQPPGITIDTAICNGDSFFGYTTSGTYVDILSTPNGCDSIRTIRLIVKPISIIRKTITVSICNGMSYNGHTISGTFIDIFKGANTCDSIQTLNLTVNPIVKKSYDVQICRGEKYFAAGKQQINSGIYIDTLKSFAGCDSITTTNLIVKELPVNFMPNDTTVCIDRNLPIHLSTFNSVIWNNGNMGNTITITQPGMYIAQVVDKYGCKGMDSTKVLFEKCIPIQIPNAFTPNQDGKNDIFKPLIPVSLVNYRMQIRNRWGQIIFETQKYLEGWNGRYNGEIQPSGTYVYFISFTDMDGFAVVKKGTLVLIK